MVRQRCCCAVLSSVVVVFTCVRSIVLFCLHSDISSDNIDCSSSNVLLSFRSLFTVDNVVVVVVVLVLFSLFLEFRSSSSNA